MSATADTTFDLFRDALLAEEDRGYPADVAFVSQDLPDVDAILWRNLRHEHRAVVVVGDDDMEFLVMPCRRSGVRGWIDGLLGCVLVELAWRHHALASPYTVRTRVSRTALADMRRPVAC